MDIYMVKRLFKSHAYRSTWKVILFEPRMPYYQDQYSFYLDDYYVQMEWRRFRYTKFLFIRVDNGNKYIIARYYPSTNRMDLLQVNFQNQKEVFNLLYRVFARLGRASLTNEGYYYAEEYISLPPSYIEKLDYLAEIGILERLPTKGFLERLYILRTPFGDFLIKVYCGLNNKDNFYKYEIARPHNAEIYNIHNPIIKNKKHLSNLLREILTTLLFFDVDYILWKLILRVKIVKYSVRDARRILEYLSIYGIITFKELKEKGLYKTARALIRVGILRVSANLVFINSKLPFKHIFKKIYRGIPLPNFPKFKKKFIGKGISEEVQAWYISYIIHIVFEKPKVIARREIRNIVSIISRKRERIKKTLSIYYDKTILQKAKIIPAEGFDKPNASLNDIVISDALQLLAGRRFSEADKSRHHESWLFVSKHRLGSWIYSVYHNGRLLVSVVIPHEKYVRIDLSRLDDYVISLYKSRGSISSDDVYSFISDALSSMDRS